MTFHLLTGEYPPASGGVGDYSQLVARALAARDCCVHVWSPAIAVEALDNGVTLRPLPDRFGPRSRQALAAAFAALPGCALLQYVPNALGSRGANLRFCLWLLRLRRRHADVRVVFHEPYFYYSRNPLGNALALVQRAMAAVLLRAGSVIYVSTETWLGYLRPMAPAGTRMIVVPIPSTVPGDAGARDVAHWRDRFSGNDATAHVVGHFGTFGDHIAGELRPVVTAILDEERRARFVCIGRGSEAFATDFAAAHASLAGRLDGTGELPRGQVAAALRACDVVVQPYPDGVTTRRTSVMAALANGVATVTTAGPLTEPVWATSGAVVLAPAGKASAIGAAVTSLLRDTPARSAVGAAGRRAYDAEFALDRTIDALLRPAGGV